MQVLWQRRWSHLTRAYAESGEEGDAVSIPNEQQVHNNVREILDEPKSGNHNNYLQGISRKCSSKENNGHQQKTDDFNDHFLGEHFDDEKLVNNLIRYLRIKSC